MTYMRKGDTVTLEMTIEDWETLLLLLGTACGIAGGSDLLTFYRHIDFVNRLNNGNPDFTPYEIPEEYRESMG